MALDPMVASSGIATAYLKYASLNEDGTNNNQPQQGDYPKAFAESYNDYAKAGEVLGATNEGGDASILEGFMRGVSGASGADVQNFAQALADFWSTVAVTPGAPSHGGTAVSKVENDAADLVNAFEAAIMASITTEEKKPYFYHLINNIESIAVSQIVWTVTELMPPSGSPSAFPEGIS